MNTKQKAASYAFPSILTIYGIREEQTGMTLRDWFAGQALAGMATHLMPNEQVAANAVEIADIVIAKLKKGGSHE